MRISIAFSGPAGSGVNTAGIFLGQLLASKGFFVVGDKEYASVIKGDNNLFVLFISDESGFLSKKIDHFFAFDEFSIKKNSQIYDIVNIHSIPKGDNFHYRNITAFGWAVRLLGIPPDEGAELIKRNLPAALTEENLRNYTAAFESASAKYDLSKSVWEKRKFFFGNEAVAQGAVLSGLWYYSAYPMTPASSISDIIGTYPEVMYFQGEDEISVAMGMLGAKFTGKRAMCGTSGGGFALMSESIAFSNQSEIGGVYVLSQRSGPSTGTPTFTEQSDIDFALCPSFGDTLPIVVYPSSFEEAHFLIWKALNWSDQYQHPVIFLLDKQFSEGYHSIVESNLQTPKINRGKFTDAPAEDFARYAITKDGISPWTIPWIENGAFIAPSYEHDEFGVSTENPEIKVQMTEKRFQKLETFIRSEFCDEFQGFSILRPESKRFFITLWSPAFAIHGFLQTSPDWGLITVNVLQPLDPSLRSFLLNSMDSIEILTFVEQNYSGQFERLVRNSCGLHDNWNSKIHSIRKYSLYPIFEEDLCVKN